MAGCVSHGFMNVNAMRADPALPFHPSSVLDHITRALLVGVEDPMSHMDEDFPTAGVAAAPKVPVDAAAGSAPGGSPAASAGASSSGFSIVAAVAAAAAAVRAGKGFDGTDDAVQAWAKESSAEFPTRRAAEERVFRTCVVLTKQMPQSTPLRVRCYNERFPPRSEMSAPALTAVTSATTASSTLTPSMEAVVAPATSVLAAMRTPPPATTPSTVP